MNSNPIFIAPLGAINSVISTGNLYELIDEYKYAYIPVNSDFVPE